MSDFRLIHAADLHIGSQMLKLERYPGAPIEMMRSAPQKAVERLFDLAMEHKVQAVLIAGDLFDGPWPDVRVGLWMVEQFRRLGREGITVYCIRGNHDALSVVRNSLQWPENVWEFGNRSETAPPLDCGICVHGRSFNHPKANEDLAATYPQKVSGKFNIGLLHTSLTGNSEHDPYAPTEIRVLEEKGYDYWALGHIHQRTERSLSNQCWIGYSGNTQGRSIRETGPKGCYLVSVEDLCLNRMDFLETDIARWQGIHLDLTTLETLAEIQELFRNALETLCQCNPQRLLAVRVHLNGSTRLHSAISNPAVHATLVDHLRSIASELECVWVEKVVVQSLPHRSDASSAPSHLLMHEIDKALQDLQSDSQFESFNEIKEQLTQRLLQQLIEMGWMSEQETQWNPDWRRMSTQARSMLEGLLVGSSKRDEGRNNSETNRMQDGP